MSHKHKQTQNKHEHNTNMNTIQTNINKKKPSLLILIGYFLWLLSEKNLNVNLFHKVGLSRLQMNISK